MTRLSHRVIVPAILVSSALFAGCPDVDDAPLQPSSEQPPSNVTPPQEQLTVIAPVRPPPISGGTLLVSRDGQRAYAADSDRDRVVEVAVSATQPTTERTFHFTSGDEPGRIVEDASEHLHVVSRGTGAILSIDLVSGSIAGRRYACAAPRGLAFDEARDRLVVACVGGEIVSMPSDPKVDEKTTIRTVADLRDVSVQGDRLFVTRFRSAELLVLDAEGAIVSQAAPLDLNDPNSKQTLAPSVAWRTLPLPGGGVVQIHQRAMASVLPQPPAGGAPAYYGPSCWEAIVQSSVTLYDPDGNVFSQPGGGRLTNVVLPVDGAVQLDGTRVAVVSAATNVVVDAPTATFRSSDWCGAGAPGTARAIAVGAEPIAVAYGAGGRLFVQTREPSTLYAIEPSANVASTWVSLGGNSAADTGHKLFHGNPDGAATITCASCHPEGRDDGRVYHFAEGPRRTISLTGGLLETAPFHWVGDLADMSTLMDAIFVKRMGGKAQSATRLSAISTYVDQLPAIEASPPIDHAAVERGRALFEDAEVGCSDCHAGPRYTSNASADVGTGGVFQVPSLVGVAHAGPFMHDGCALTLRDRFGSPCGGGDQHGHTSQLDDAQIDDLVAYLVTL